MSDDISQWTASDGTIPYGDDLIAAWRDRVALDGGTTLPFISRLDDSEDWDE
jgi:hypothetical protein